MPSDLVEYRSRELSSSAARITDPDAAEASSEQILRSIMYRQVSGSAASASIMRGKFNTTNPSLSDGDTEIVQLNSAAQLEVDLASASLSSNLAVERQFYTNDYVPGATPNASRRRLNNREMQFWSGSTDLTANGTQKKTLDCEGAAELAASITVSSSNTVSWDVRAEWYDDSSHTNLARTEDLSTGNGANANVNVSTPSKSDWCDLIVEETNGAASGSLSGAIKHRA